MSASRYASSLHRTVGSNSPLPPLTPPSPRWAMEGDFIWPRVLQARARMTVPYKSDDDAQKRVIVSPHPRLFLQPVGLGRGAQAKADQGRHLSEAIAEFVPDPAFFEHRRLPAEKRRVPDHRVALSLLTFSWRRKRKRVACRCETRPV